MNRLHALVLGLLLAGALIAPFKVANAQQRETSGGPPKPRYIGGVSATLPLSFEINRGQTDGSVKFLARGRGYTVFLAADQAVISLASAPIIWTAPTAARSVLKGPAPVNMSPPNTTTLRLRFVGADARAAGEGLYPLAGKVSYFIGNDESQWRTGIPTYARVGFRAIYPGIDLAYYGDQQQLKFDLMVAPGASPDVISLSFDGANEIGIDAKTGDLVVTAGGSRIQWRKPSLYQDLPTGRQAIEGGYVLGKDNLVHFKVGRYDATRPLIIDPRLVYSTYLGGGAGDVSFTLAVDALGDAYVTGLTNSPDFPTTPGTFPPPADVHSRWNAFVTKVNPAGTALLYSTYFGGTDFDGASGIAIDAGGQAYVTGVTSSSDFPRATGRFRGGSMRGLPGDAFVAVLTPDGGLSNAIYLGGSGYDHGTDITLDSGGNIYVTGYTASTDFPTTLGAFQTAYGGGEFDAFVVKLDPAAATPIYSTYLGGNTDDRGGGITVHTATRNVFITGCTNSRNFPNRLGFTDRPGGGFDAFVTWLNAAGNDVIFSTWYGGSGDDCGWAIAVDPFGQAWITGATRSRDLPFAAGVFGSGVDAFVAKFQPFDGSLGYATYLGGRGDDLGHAIAVDALFNVYVAGETSSANFPTTPDAVQSRYAGGGCLVLFPDIYGVIGCGDGFLTVFRTRDIGSEAVAFSTYLGGSLVDYFNGVGLDAVGNVYLSGNTGSSDFPATPGVQQPSFAGGGDTVLVKLSPPQFTTAQAPSFRYAAKIICGKSPGRLHAAGAYFTVVNVHNPTDRQIALTKRLAFVDVAEKAGPVSESAKAMLGPDQALAVDCPDLRQLSGGTQEFLEGYLLIDNLTQLDVVATYSAAGENGLVTTLDVQSIAPTAVAHSAGTAH